MPAVSPLPVNRRGQERADEPETKPGGAKRKGETTMTINREIKATTLAWHEIAERIENAEHGDVFRVGDGHHEGTLLVWAGKWVVISLDDGTVRQVASVEVVFDDEPDEYLATCCDGIIHDGRQNPGVWVVESEREETES